MMRIIFLLLIIFAAGCRKDVCETLPARYSSLKANFEQIQHKLDDKNHSDYKLRLEKMLKQAERLQSDSEGCDLGKNNLEGFMRDLITGDKIGKLKTQIEEALKHPSKKPGLVDAFIITQKIHLSIRELYGASYLDQAGNVTFDGHSFYIESVIIQAIDSGLLITCERNNGCISNSERSLNVQVDYMKAKRLAQYLEDYRMLMACKHSGKKCSEIVAKY
jgi:hypothetical protein